MVKRFYKHKLLLDENMPLRSDLPQLNKHFDVKHVDHDLKQGGISDQKVYNLAVTQKRIIITRNTKHFLPLAGTKADVGIIGIPPHWFTTQVDNKLISFLKTKTPKTLRKKLIPLSKVQK